MGKQMGKVHTLNVPPLGYERKGGVKVFTLVAQPVEHTFGDGNPPDPAVTKVMNRMFGLSSREQSKPQPARPGAGE